MTLPPHNHPDNPANVQADQPQVSSLAYGLKDPNRAIRLDKVQLRASVCEHCGHSLVGLELHNAQVRCPECGKLFHAGLKLQEFSRRDRASRRPNSRSLVIWTSLVAFTVLIAGQFGTFPFLASLAFAAFVLVVMLVSVFWPREKTKAEAATGMTYITSRQ